MATRQQAINKLLKNTGCSVDVFTTYGKWLKINMFVFLLFVDFVVPTFRLLTLFAMKYKRQLKNMEITRISIK